MLPSLFDEVSITVDFRETGFALGILISPVRLAFYDRLEATSFKPRKDQRKAVNRWTKFVLGPSYIRNAARLCPKTREYVYPRTVAPTGSLFRMSKN